MPCAKLFGITVNALNLSGLAWGAPTYDNSCGTATGTFDGPHFDIVLNYTIPACFSTSASNSATLPISSIPDTNFKLSVDWTASVGNGGLNFQIDVGTANLGVIKTVFPADCGGGVPGYYEFLFTIPATAADTLQVSINGDVSGYGFASQSELDCLLEIVP